MKELPLLVLLLLAGAVNAGDFSLIGGKMLNNVDASRPGAIYGVEVSHFWGSHGARFNYQRVGGTWIAENMAYSTLSFTERRGPFAVSFGVVSEISYATSGYWLGVHYPNDGVHFSKSCRWCGSSYALDYMVTKRITVRGWYIEENRLDPTYNGLAVGLLLTL